jgi:hypothetical protein
MPARKPQIYEAAAKAIRDAGYQVDWWLHMEGGDPSKNGGKFYEVRAVRNADGATFKLERPGMTEALVAMAQMLGISLGNN